MTTNRRRLTWGWVGLAAVIAIPVLMFLFGSGDVKVRMGTGIFTGAFLGIAYGGSIALARFLIRKRNSRGGELVQSYRKWLEFDIIEQLDPFAGPQAFLGPVGPADA